MQGKYPQDLDRFSAVLLDLHKLPQQVEFAQFQNAALTLLARSVPFDSAWWGLVSGLTIHTEARFNLPDRYPEAWERIKGSDPIAAASAAAPFVTACFNADDLAPFPVVQETLGAFGIRHVLCTQTSEPALGLFAFISLYRNGLPFTQSERCFKQAVMPHMIHTLHLNWRKHLETAQFATAGNNQVSADAITDTSGLILSPEALFGRFITVEWPRWKGPLLPDDLRPNLKSKRDYRGRKIRLSFRDVSGLVLVRAVERRLLSELTDREMKVAELYAAGETHKLIAQRLGITPNTARHYIRTIFNKLQVSNKAELTRLLYSVGSLGAERDTTRLQA